MISRQDETRHAINTFFEETRDDGTEDVVFYSVTKFDTQVRTIHELKPLENFNEITEKDYYCCGCTALLDAIGERIKQVEKHLTEFEEDNQPSVLFVVMTDGEENSSRSFSTSKIKEMIAEKEADGNWTFVYMGSSPESWDESNKAGFNVGNTVKIDENNYKGAVQALYHSSNMLRERKRSAAPGVCVGWKGMVTDTASTWEKAGSEVRNVAEAITAVKLEKVEVDTVTAS